MAAMVATAEPAATVAPPARATPAAAGPRTGFDAEVKPCAAAVPAKAPAGKVETGSAGLIGESASMQEVFRTIGRLSRTSISVLITGETGSGKEVVAQVLHQQADAGGGFLLTGFDWRCGRAMKVGPACQQSEADDAAHGQYRPAVRTGTGAGSGRGRPMAGMDFFLHRQHNSGRYRSP